MTELLFQKLQRLKEEVAYLKDNRERFLLTLRSSIDTRKIVERSVFLTSEMVLDLADLVIIKKGYPKPGTYRDSIYKLGEFKIVPEEFAYNFTYIAGLRNFLAHDYLKETVPTLENFLKAGLSDVETFISHMEKAR
ncbi:MAG: hypothetical protein A2055_01100 [Deltaproteobacteria bacterium GWA2_47_9]|nr:MAG: hypothetical protein A2055_01100 [Deltaproteobacteria bacterium GWA2_47_9]